MIETTITKIQYDADGVQRRWSIPFPYADVKHISIYTKVGDEPTVKVVDNYDIDEDDAVVIYPTVASEQEPLASGTKITIARETPETQLEDSSQIHFTSKDVERGLDKLTMITQELSTISGETMEVSAAAFESAEKAVNIANEANTTANEAKTLAEQAVSTANDANATATAANTKSDTAIKIANDANEKSTAAVSTANTAKTVADEANSTANKANATAIEAKEIAAVANTTANNADKTANEADKKADNAVIVANNAKNIAEGIDAKATQALANSNAAVNTANSAKQTAEGIDGKATQALADSATALETATQAKQTADSYQGQITTLRNDVDDLGDQVAVIEGKIPAEATTANPLADKEFVTTITDELAADIAALDADKADKATTLAGYGITNAYTKTETDNAIKAINLIKWVESLPTTGETKYLYAVAREETDKEGKKIVALYLWDGTEWRGAGGTSVTTDNLVTTDTFQEITARKDFNDSVYLNSEVKVKTSVIFQNGATGIKSGTTSSSSGVTVGDYSVPVEIYTSGFNINTKHPSAGAIRPATLNGKQIATVDDVAAAGGDNGIKGDYCTSYGILEAPNGILTNPSGMQVTLKQGVVLQLAGQDIKTTVSGDMTQTLTSTADCDLFYVSGTTSLMEVAQIVWSKMEPDNGATGVLAWWNPDNGKWKFKSNDTGNVWAEAVATPVAHIHTDGTTITRIDHIGYRVLDDEIFNGFDFEGTKAEFDAAVTAGTITDDSVSIITDDVSGDEVATKADLAVVENNSNNLTNLSDTGKTKIKNSLANYALRFPDYNAAITLDSTVNVKKQYIAPSDGWISYTLFERTNTTNIVASVDTPGKGAVVWVNGNRISEVANWDAYVHYVTSYLFHPVKAGDVIDYYIFSQGFLYFYPMLGAN